MLRHSRSHLPSDTFTLHSPPTVTHSLFTLPSHSPRGPKPNLFLYCLQGALYFSIVTSTSRAPSRPTSGSVITCTVYVGLLGSRLARRQRHTSAPVVRQMCTVTHQTDSRPVAGGDERTRPLSVLCPRPLIKRADRRREGMLEWKVDGVSADCGCYFSCLFHIKRKVSSQRG